MQQQQQQQQQLAVASVLAVAVTDGWRQTACKPGSILSRIC